MTRFPAAKRRQGLPHVPLVPRTLRCSLPSPPHQTQHSGIPRRRSPLRGAPKIPTENATGAKSGTGSGTERRTDRGRGTETETDLLNLKTDTRTERGANASVPQKPGIKNRASLGITIGAKIPTRRAWCILNKEMRPRPHFPGGKATPLPFASQQMDIRDIGQRMGRLPP